MDREAHSAASAARRVRFDDALLYLVCAARPGGREPEDVLRAAIAGGVGMVQLREKELGDSALGEITKRFLEVCRPHNVPVIVNDRPEVAVAAGADGVHVGQDDTRTGRVRELVPDQMIVGLSTHSPEQIADVDPSFVDYIGVGPVFETPTKPGRPAVGLTLVEHAGQHAPVPWFAIGGINVSNASEVVGAGAKRVAVVRAVAEADDPEPEARALVDILRGVPDQ